MINILLAGLTSFAFLGEKAEAKPVKPSPAGIVVQQPKPSFCEKVWIEGHYETRCEQVWVPARQDEIWIEPTYLTAPDGQQIFWNGGYWKKVKVPGHYETRRYEVFVPGTWVFR